MRCGNRLALIAVVFSTLLFPASALSSLEETSQLIWPTESWQVADPSAVGLEPAPLELLLTRIRSGDIRDIHSLLIVKDGYLVVEEYFPGGSREQLHTMQSVSKSITSTLIAAAIQRGLIDSTDDHLLDFFPHTQNITHLDDLKKGGFHKTGASDLFANAPYRSYAAYSMVMENSSRQGPPPGWDRSQNRLQ